MNNLSWFLYLAEVIPNVGVAGLAVVSLSVMGFIFLAKKRR